VKCSTTPPVIHNVEPLDEEPNLSENRTVSESIGSACLDGTIPGSNANQLPKMPAPLHSPRPRALYLFAGPKRRSGIAFLLGKLGWEVKEYDILRCKSHDLTMPATQQLLLRRIVANEFSAVLGSAPCDTFTRVKFANNLGPAPTRSSVEPRGFSHLRGGARLANELGNILMDFLFEALHAQA
jgi:hypothetical protein